MSEMKVPSTESQQAPVLDVQDLVVDYRLPGRRRALVHAVRGVSFAMNRGRTVGLVGESGSGKSTIGNAVLGLVPVTSGTVRFHGREITNSDRRERRLLARRMQVVFQDPFGSMNPALTVGDTMAEALRFNLELPVEERRARLEQALRDVGLPPETEHRYPSEFSGGQRQRIAIARALVMQPEFIVCDEAVSALDLSVQAQILNLLTRLKAEHGLSYLFISHDLAVVRYISDDIVVLYAGQVMEQGPADVVAENPRHPYTRALIEAAPEPDPEVQRERQETRLRMRGSMGAVPGTGCPFAARCPHVFDRCTTERPELRPNSGVLVACHLVDPDPATTQRDVRPPIDLHRDTEEKEEHRWPR